jgi:hypothetical protein
MEMMLIVQTDMVMVCADGGLAGGAHLDRPLMKAAA